MMKKLNIKISAIFLALAFTFSCSEDFLTVTPNAALDAQVLATPTGVDALLIGAYSMLSGTADNGFGWEAATSNWVYGSIRGLEANKGTDSGDQPDINPIQTYTETSTNPYLNVKWRSCYEGISRVNETLKVLAVAEANGRVTPDQADRFKRQARALRGFYHFEAWRMWEKIPYSDETTNLQEVTNQQDVRASIIADLEAGAGLPNNMGQVGRFNGTVAKVLLAKAEMQMNKDYAKARGILQDVISTGTAPDGSAIGLEEKYGDIFDIVNRNGIEAIYTVQYSVNDGSGGWNGGWGEVLNFPYKSGASPGGCCGFFQPSFDFVNSFRTRNGLPLLDNSYNQQPVVNDQGLAVNAPFTPDQGPLDPRLDWSVGRRGIPYLDWGPHTGQDWIRDQSYAGPYSPKKQVYRLSQQGQFTEVGNWTSGWTANGYRLIRYADVLLLLAECQIETNDLAGARTNINIIRQRAANPDGFVLDDENKPAANYQIELYPAAGAPFDNQENARTALRFERKLELGMEGHRFFDLQRWGSAYAVAELNRILNHERTLLPALYGAATVTPQSMLFPIPQDQIDLMGGRLVQNQ
jgi:hypothetical protein